MLATAFSSSIHEVSCEDRKGSEMKKKSERDSGESRDVRQLKEQLHLLAGRMRRDGPWAPCEIMIMLHDDPRRNAV